MLERRGDWCAGPAPLRVAAHGEPETTTCGPAPVAPLAPRRRVVICEPSAAPISGRSGMGPAVGGGRAGRSGRHLTAPQACTTKSTLKLTCSLFWSQTELHCNCYIADRGSRQASQLSPARMGCSWAAPTVASGRCHAATLAASGQPTRPVSTYAVPTWMHRAPVCDRR